MLNVEESTIFNLLDTFLEDEVNILTFCVCKPLLTTQFSKEKLL